MMQYSHVIIKPLQSSKLNELLLGVGRFHLFHFSFGFARIFRKDEVPVFTSLVILFVRLLGLLLVI